MESENIRINFDKWPIRYEDILEKGLIRYNSVFSMPTLQYMSSVKLITSLWYKQLQRPELATGFKVCEIANKVKAEMVEIVRPKQLRENLPHLIILMGQDLSNWIDFYDYHVFGLLKRRKNYKSVAIAHIDKIAWSSRGTINHMKTAKAMLNVKKSRRCKRCLKLCNTCQKSDDVLIGFPAFVYNMDSSWDEEENPMKHLWIHFMGKPVEEWDRLKQSNCLYCFEREISVYLRDTPDMDKDVEVIFDTRYKFHIDYSCYIVSKLNKQQQDQLLELNVFYDEVIPKLLMEPLYVDYFLPTLYHMKDNISAENVSLVLGNLNNLIKDHYGDESKGYSYLFDKYVFCFEQLWSFLPRNTKDTAIHMQTTAFDWMWEYDLLHLLSKYFEDCRPMAKNMILSCDKAMSFCEEMLKNEQWEVFERHVSPVFFNTAVEELVNVKLWFVSNIKNVFCHFMELKKWQELDKLFEWSYDVETERAEQKKALVLKVLLSEVNSGRILPNKRYKNPDEYHTEPISPRVTNFAYFDEVLNWCFSSKREIDKFKQTKFCKNGSFTAVICTMMVRRRMEIIDQIVYWVFNGNKKLIDKFCKSNIIAGGMEDEPPKKARKTK